MYFGCGSILSNTKLRKSKDGEDKELLLPKKSTSVTNIQKTDVPPISIRRKDLKSLTSLNDNYIHNNGNSPIKLKSCLSTQKQCAKLKLRVKFLEKDERSHQLLRTKSAHCFNKIKTTSIDTHEPAEHTNDTPSASTQPTLLINEQNNIQFNKQYMAGDNNLVENHYLLKTIKNNTVDKELSDTGFIQGDKQKSKNSPNYSSNKKYYIFKSILHPNYQFWTHTSSQSLNKNNFLISKHLNTYAGKRKKFHNNNSAAIATGSKVQKNFCTFFYEDICVTGKKLSLWVKHKRPKKRCNTFFRGYCQSRTGITKQCLVNFTPQLRILNNYQLKKRHRPNKLNLRRTFTVYKNILTVPGSANFYVFSNKNSMLLKKMEHPILQKNTNKRNYDTNFSEKYDIASNSLLKHKVSRTISGDKDLSCLTATILDIANSQPKINQTNFSMDSILFFNKSPVCKKLANCVNKFRNKNKKCREECKNDIAESRRLWQIKNKMGDDFLDQDFNNDDDGDVRRLRKPYNRGKDRRHGEYTDFDLPHRPKKYKQQNKARLYSDSASNDADDYPHRKENKYDNDQTKPKLKTQRPKTNRYDNNERGRSFISEDDDDNMYRDDNRIRKNRKIKRFNKNYDADDGGFGSKDYDDEFANGSDTYKGISEANPKSKFKPKIKRTNRNKTYRNFSDSDSDDNLPNNMNKYEDNAKRKNRTNLDPSPKRYNKTKYSFENDEPDKSIGHKTKLHDDRPEQKKSRLNLERHHRNKPYRDFTGEFSDDDNGMDNKKKIGPLPERYFKNKTRLRIENEDFDDDVKHRSKFYGDSPELSLKLRRQKRNKPYRRLENEISDDEDTASRRIPPRSFIKNKTNQRLVDDDFDNNYFGKTNMYSPTRYKKDNHSSENGDFDDDIAEKDDLDKRDRLYQKVYKKIKYSKQQSECECPKNISKRGKTFEAPEDRTDAKMTDPDLFDDYDDDFANVRRHGPSSDHYKLRNRRISDPKYARYHKNDYGFANTDSDDEFANRAYTNDESMYSPKASETWTNRKRSDCRCVKDKVKGLNRKQRNDCECVNEMISRSNSFDNYGLVGDRRALSPKSNAKGRNRKQRSDCECAKEMLKRTKSAEEKRNKRRRVRKLKTECECLKKLLKKKKTVEDDGVMDNHYYKRDENSPRFERYFKNEPYRSDPKSNFDDDAISRDDSIYNGNRKSKNSPAHERYYRNIPYRGFENEDFEDDLVNKPAKKNKIMLRPNANKDEEDRGQHNDCECPPGFLNRTKPFQSPGEVDPKNRYKIDKKRQNDDLQNRQRRYDDDDKKINKKFNPKPVRDNIYKRNRSLPYNDVDDDFMDVDDREKYIRKKMRENQEEDTDSLKKRKKWYKNLKKELENEFTNRLQKDKKKTPSGIQLKIGGKLAPPVKKGFDMKVSERDISDAIENALNSVASREIRSELDDVNRKLRLELSYDKFGETGELTISRRLCDCYLAKYTHKLLTQRDYKRNKINRDTERKKRRRKSTLQEININFYSSILSPKYMDKYLYARTLNKRPCSIILYRIWLHLCPRLNNCIQHTKHATRLCLLGLAFACWSPKTRK